MTEMQRKMLEILTEIDTLDRMLGESSDIKVGSEIERRKAELREQLDRLVLDKRSHTKKNKQPL